MTEWNLNDLRLFALIVNVAFNFSIYADGLLLTIDYYTTVRPISLEGKGFKPFNLGAFEY